MPTLRRYNSRGGNAYPLSDERELPPSLRHDIYTTSRGQHLPPHESRNSDRRSPENDSATRPRSRIPVAVSYFLLRIRSDTEFNHLVWSVSEAQD